MPIAPALGYGFADKLVHFFEFLIVTLWFGGLYHGAARLLIAMALALLGLGIEFLQGLQIYRTFDTADIAANLLGIAVALAMLWRWFSDWPERVRDRLT